MGSLRYRCLLLQMIWIIELVSGQTGPGWQPWNGNSYFISQQYDSTLTLSYADAESNCVQRGATLASTLSQEEATFIVNQYGPGADGCWFGLYLEVAFEDCPSNYCTSCSSIDTSGACTNCNRCRRAWSWKDGSTMDWINWNLVQPNEQARCGRLHPDGKWYDQNCALAKCFVCKTGLNQPTTSTTTTTTTTTLAPTTTSSTTVITTKPTTTTSTQPSTIATQPSTTTSSTTIQPSSTKSVSASGKPLTTGSPVITSPDTSGETTPYDNTTQSSTTQPRLPRPEKSESFPFEAVVGISVGAILVLVAVPGIVFCLCVRLSQKRTGDIEGHTQHGYPISAYDEIDEGTDRTSNGDARQNGHAYSNPAMETSSEEIDNQEYMSTSKPDNSHTFMNSEISEGNSIQDGDMQPAYVTTVSINEQPEEVDNEVDNNDNTADSDRDEGFSTFRDYDQSENTNNGVSDEGIILDY